MNEQQFLRYWYIGAATVTAIVAVVAALLLAIIATARSILANAKRALSVAEEIVKTTAPIWELETTNAVAGQLLEEVEAIAQHATSIANQLEAPPVQAR